MAATTVAAALVVTGSVAAEMTEDEKSSGIIDATTQAESLKLVKGGQLYLMTVADWTAVDFK